MESFAQKRNSAKKLDYRLTAFGEEKYPAYDRVHLTNYFARRQAQDLFLSDRNWYTRNKVELLTSSKIVEIDSIKKNIESENGDKYSYDKLVLATGSKPFVPTIPGIGVDGCFVYRTITDLDQIIAFAEKCKSAAVIGGGLLGLEACKALLDLQLETHVIEFAPYLMYQQLDAQAAQLLEKEIISLGMQVHTSKETKSIHKDKKLNTVV